MQGNKVNQADRRLFTVTISFCIKVLIDVYSLPDLSLHVLLTFWSFIKTAITNTDSCDLRIIKSFICNLKRFLRNQRQINKSPQISGQKHPFNSCPKAGVWQLSRVKRCLSHNILNGAGCHGGMHHLMSIRLN